MASERTLLRVSGMWCASCARAAERALAALDGVESARVNATTGAAVIEHGATTSRDAMLDAVARAGYRASSWERVDGIDIPDPRGDLAVRFAVGVLFGMWVMLLQLAGYVSELGAQANLVAAAAGAFATPVVFVVGARFHRAGWRTLKVGAPGMDFLVSAGSLTAWGLSVASLLRGASDVWFDTATMLIVFLLGGRLLDASVRQRGFDAVRVLVDLAPERARLASDGRLVAATTLSEGDEIRVLEGDRVPVDGIAVSGSGSIDRAALTGESEPEPAAPGDHVFAGTSLASGELEVRVTRGVGARRIDAIAQRVRHALDQRMPMQVIADRFAERLVPWVIAIASGSALVAALSGIEATDAVLRGVAVLVVTCPCALALAAPLTVAFVVGRAGRFGIVFRDPDALERAATIDTVVFDKTGTLTAPGATVDVRAAPGYEPDTVLAWAASAEWGSAHPIAKTLRHAAERRGCAIDARGLREELRGAGVRWVGAAGEVRVGSGRWLAEYQPRLRKGEIAVVRNDVWVGSITVRDALREGVVDTIASLRSEGRTLHLWSGDSLANVNRVARRLAIEHVRGECRPEDKADALDQLEQAHASVAFVGDGINDAPALARAHLGIAVQGASDSALAVAPVVLLSGGLDRVRLVLILAERARRTIRQNLFWAIAYNALAIPAAAAGLVGPLLAPLAMIASSLTVTLNASRLLKEPRGVSKAVPVRWSAWRSTNL